MQRACLQVKHSANSVSELLRLLAGLGARAPRLRVEVDPAALDKHPSMQQCGF